MTEYGRGSGSQPWHPEDPLYGDQGYNGQQYPQQHQPQQSQPPYGQQQHYPEQQQGHGWDPSQDTGGHYVPQPGGQYAGQGGGSYPGEGQGHYGTPQEAYPPQQHAPYVGEQRQGGHEQLQQQSAPQGLHEEWRPEPDQDKISLFDDPPEAPSAPAEDEPEPDEGRGRGRDRRGKGKKKNKRRSGTACLLVAVVLVGGVGGLGYLGYDYWEANFGPAPDYDGEGTGQVQVEIPKGSGLTQMGDILQKNGVVKSSRAFTEAAGESAKGKGIQPGTYTLHKEMSAQAAIAMMTDTKNLLTFGEGTRAAEVYAAIDKKLGLKAGTTQDVAKSQAKNLGLPDWAGTEADIKDPLEGFLFPSQYNAAKGTKPEDLLRQMVARAKDNYAEQDLDGKAKELGLKSPLQVLTVASLVQAEGRYKHDFDKVSRVIYNRLKPDNKETYGLLDFDSTVNYAKKTSTLDTGAVSDLRQFKDPYNTYKIKGLPPGPIDNPGLEALKSALQPAPGPWYYFVSINENETLFAVTNEEQNRNREKYNQAHKKGGQ
ncbi:UPF0755 protein [Streptomyces olivoverticillatus]|uniref:Endolytic murein transglycosylase n=1 Tax=Streptomyces olivoverticillatus TaxID=66427 RepID=A0A7W7PMA8_9ACTN|nr:endolytic transglycosylase MltG [Streptomyces olivoverticillatus]MBB4895144.1 UPF0755 protein [Streptomyces olivoverticillatus]